VCRKDLKKLPFHKPEQLETIDRDADFITYFTSFLYRTQSSPIQNYPVALHPVPCSNLESLHRLLVDGDDQDVTIAFHRFLCSLLTYPSQQFLSNEWQDPFLRFLIAYHLEDDHGTFVRVVLIPPNLSKAQWAFRATCAKEIELEREKFQGDVYALVHLFSVLLHYLSV
jgi:hypothetical protein